MRTSVSITACPACHSRPVRLLPRSRRSGRRVFSCRACGLAGWDDRQSLPHAETVGLAEIPADEIAEWVDSKRAAAVRADWEDALTRVTDLLGGADGRRLYDIGAGDGGFLVAARERGFGIGGNDVVQAAVVLAQRTNGLALDLGDIATLDLEPQDAITLWCVIAHVADPAALLAECFRRLRPGGVLFLQTPHRTLLDSAALLALWASRGRIARLVDRRIAQHHWLLQSRRSMGAMLREAGFDVVDTVAQPRYSLMSQYYLASLGVGPRAGRWLGRAMDVLVRTRLAPRIVLDAYARRPDRHDTGGGNP